MIAICADETSAEVNGTVDDLDAIHHAIVSLISTANSSVRIAAASLDPSPYPRALSALAGC